MNSKGKKVTWFGVKPDGQGTDVSVMLLNILKQVRLQLIIIILIHKWYWLALCLRNTCLPELYFEVLLVVTLWIGGWTSCLLDLVNGQWWTCSLEDVSRQSGYMSAVTTSKVSPSGTSGCMHQLIEENKTWPSKQCGKVKTLWLRGQKDLGLNSASPVVNCMILGWWFNYTEPQILHL